MKMKMKMTNKDKVRKDTWSQRLSSNTSDADEIDRLIREYNSKYAEATPITWKIPKTHVILSELANNVTMAAAFHAKNGKPHLWSTAKSYSKRSKEHKALAKQFEYGVQNTLF